MRGLIDSTLREGEQTVGVSFAPASKLAIVKLLARVGVEEVELGIATPRNDCLLELIARAREISPRPQLSFWCRCRPEDIIFAASLAPDVLSLSIPASDLHLTTRLGQHRTWALATLRASLRQAQDLGLSRLSVGLEDATRADESFLLELAATAAATGAFRCRLADTVGIGSPERIGKLVRRLRSSVDVELGIHTHNDFGMATANAVAALEAGAEWADVTVLGLGERAGNARLEEVAGFLALTGLRDYRTEWLREICHLVAKATDREISPHRPVVGEKIFFCESGLHLQGLVRDPATYEPYAPERVGARRELQIGGKAGRQAVQDRLAALGLALPESTLEAAVGRILRQAAGRGILTDEEILAAASPDQ
jgi:homocitrate synthase NifV